MISVMTGSRTWNPDSRRGEGTSGNRLLKRADIWFWIGLLVLSVLIYLVGQQSMSIKIADEIARLEMEKESLQDVLRQREAVVLSLSQIGNLIDTTDETDLENTDLTGRVFVRAEPLPEMYKVGEKTMTTLAGIDFSVAEALASER
ncbi:MAG: hypothetical protein GY835_20830 [bacterium]|nr:hypothetical protein [bacterium]